MLLNAPSASPAPKAIQPAPGWMAAIGAGLGRLARLCRPRPASEGLDGLDAAALKDIGLSRGDLPALKSGRFFHDPTRKQR